MPVTEQTCFIISQIGSPDSPERIHADNFLKYIVHRCPEIDAFKYKVVRAETIAEPGRITSQVIDHVVNAGLVIADLSGLNVNVFYELAVRHISKKPLIPCATNDTRLPFDTRDYRTIPYSFHVSDAEKAVLDLGEQIRAINAGDFVPHDPIGDAVQISMLKASPEPQMQILGEVLEAIRGMSSRLDRLERVETSPTRMNALIYPNPSAETVLQPTAWDVGALARAAKLAGIKGIAITKAIDDIMSPTAPVVGSTQRPTPKTPRST